MSGAEMLIVAGPPGAGKSSVFPLGTFYERAFNADDRAAKLNQGSYRSIPLDVRRQVNREFERFVSDNIAQGRSFALETTLRSNITFEQAKLARSLGFRTAMIYVGLDSFELHIERVRRRALLGGHAASELTLRRIYDSSLANLPQALDPERSGIGEVRIFDNSAFDASPALLVTARDGKLVDLAAHIPAWLRGALNWSDLDLERLRNPKRLGTPPV